MHGIKLWQTRDGMFRAPIDDQVAQRHSIVGYRLNTTDTMEPAAGERID